MEQFDFSVKRGESLEQDILFCEMINGVRVPISLTGVVAKAEIRPNPGSQKLLGSFDCEVVPADGKVIIQLTSANTIALNKGLYAWDLYLENADEALAKYPIGGQFIVYDHVTEPAS